MRTPPEDTAARAPREVEVNSPSRQVSARVRIEANGDAGPYGRLVIAAGLTPGIPDVEAWPELELVDGRRIGPECLIERVEMSASRESFRQVPGTRSRVLVEAGQAVITLLERPAAPADPDPSERRWTLTVRAADDGVAFRATIDRPDDPPCDLARENTRFMLPSTARVWALPLNSFTTSHEGRYEAVAARDVPPEWLMATPLLASLPEGAWASITEANLTDYAGMYLSRDPDASESAPPGGPVPLISRLSPRPDDPACAVRARAPLRTPWRVILLADSPGRFLESDLILALNEPCALEDVSWIRPGKTTFPWWNGYVDPVATAQGIDVALNTATAKYYIDFCAAHGIPYHTLDGKNDLAWYGGPIGYRGADPTTPVEGLDLPEVLRYAREKGVGIRVWMHWKAARDHMERAFPLYRQWGIEGVMLDFMDRDDQEMIRWQRAAIELAAANHLTVTMHGVAKPTGLERTYPNLLNSEGVWNLEQNKWDQWGCTPRHELTTFFTRMVAGPMDFHQGGVRTVAPAAYLPSWEAPVVIGTPARALASYVVIENHLPMMCDYPSAYEASPVVDAIARVPVSWDDTRVLSAEVGESVAIARRAGDAWWVAAMTSHPRRMTLTLSFLGRGTYDATLWTDAPNADRVARSTRSVASGDTIPIELSEAGAAVIELRPQP